MASPCRSLATICSKSLRPRISFVRSAAPISVPYPSFTFPVISSPVYPTSTASFSGTLGSWQPLHSAIAASRLRSNIGSTTISWSWLSQDLGTPR